MPRRGRAREPEKIYRWNIGAADPGHAGMLEVWYELHSSDRAGLIAFYNRETASITAEVPEFGAAHRDLNQALADSGWIVVGPVEVGEGGATERLASGSRISRCCNAHGMRMRAARAATLGCPVCDVQVAVISKSLPAGSALRGMRKLLYEVSAVVTGGDNPFVRGIIPPTGITDNDRCGARFGWWNMNECTRAVRHLVGVAGQLPPVPASGMRRQLRNIIQQHGQEPALFGLDPERDERASGQHRNSLATSLRSTPIQIHTRDLMEDASEVLRRAASLAYGRGGQLGSCSASSSLRGVSDEARAVLGDVQSGSMSVEQAIAKLEEMRRWLQENPAGPDKPADDRGRDIQWD